MPRNRSIVTAAAVAASDRHVRRIGVRRALRRLEKAEPELAEYLMESATMLYAKLDRSGAAYRSVRAIHTQAVMLALVCINATRRST